MIRIECILSAGNNDCWSEINIEKAKQYASFCGKRAPEEIASVAAFLSSDDSSFVTGECIVVYGGSYI